MRSAARIGVCEVCGAQFLRQGPNRHGTTCSAACLGWLRVKNKAQAEARAPAAPAKTLLREMKRATAKTDRSVSGSLAWVVVWNDPADGREYREASRSRALALNAACDLISQRHTVQRIEGRHGVIIEQGEIERYCRARLRPP